MFDSPPVDDFQPVKNVFADLEYAPDIYTVEDFIETCKCGAFIDYDGHGHPVRDGKEDPRHWIYPSRLDLIPPEATHINWFNR